MSNRLYESEIEQIALDILRDENGYATTFGPEISEGERKEREYTEELIHLAKEIREADTRGETLNLRMDELAFYDALADNPTAEAVLGDQVLKQIAHDLVESVRKNTSIDWQLKESVQAKLRVLVKRILR